MHLCLNSCFAADVIHKIDIIGNLRSSSVMVCDFFVRTVLKIERSSSVFTQDQISVNPEGAL